MVFFWKDDDDDSGGSWDLQLGIVIVRVNFIMT